ncbi:MAG: hypothetical protein J6W41_00130 [Alphaproteobacteria bacterium]|nr:hypothetical protein [Alphaproteobacteria bacterium]
MNDQRQNDFKQHNPKYSRLDTDWDDLKNRLGMLLYQAKQNNDFAVVNQISKLLSVMYKNKPTKQLLRSIEQRIEKLCNNTQAHTR